MVIFGQLLRSWALKTTSIRRDLQLDSRKYSGVGVLLKTAPDNYYRFCVSHRPVRKTESLGLWMYFHRKPRSFQVIVPELQQILSPHCLSKHALYRPGRINLSAPSTCLPYLQLLLIPWVKSLLQLALILSRE